MARYYGLGQTAGFADGLAQGFGLVNEVYNDKEINRLKQEELDATAGYRMAETEATSKYRDQQIGIEQGQLDLDNERLGLDKKESAATIAGLQADNQVRLINAKTAGVNATTAATNADTNRFVREEAGTQAQFLRDEKARQLNLQQAGETLASLDIAFKESARTGVPVPTEVIQNAIEMTDKTPLSVARAVSSLAPVNMEVMNTTLQGVFSEGGDINDEKALEVVGEFLNQNTEVGRVMSTATDVNLPIAYDGWLMYKKDLLSASASVDGETPTLSAMARITLQNPKDPTQFVHYDAPVTRGRGAGSSEAGQFPVAEFLSGTAGYAVQVRYAQENFRPLLEQHRIDTMYGNAGEYQTALLAEQSRLAEWVTDYPTSQPLVAGVDNNTLTQKVINSAAKDNTLNMGNPKVMSFIPDSTSSIIDFRAFMDSDPKLKALQQSYQIPSKNKNGVTEGVPVKLTDSEVLILMSTTDTTTGKDGTDVTNPTPRTRTVLADLMAKRGNVTQLERKGNPLFKVFGSGNSEELPDMSMMAGAGIKR